VKRPETGGPQNALALAAHGHMQTGGDLRDRHQRAGSAEAPMLRAPPASPLDEIRNCFLLPRRYKTE